MTTTNLIGTYTNGNYEVQLFEDGTKIRITQETAFKPMYPESVDLKITDFCNAGCQWCFVKGTLIQTIDQNKSIEDIKTGDLVYGLNMKTLLKEVQEVKTVYKRMFEASLYKIELDSGSFLVTGNHKIYTKRGWVEARDLIVEDELVSSNECSI